MVVITGSAQGLGKAFAKRLLQDGARVTITNTNAIMIIISILISLTAIMINTSIIKLSHIRERLRSSSQPVFQVCLSDIQWSVGLATKAEFQVFLHCNKCHSSESLILSENFFNPI